METFDSLGAQQEPIEPKPVAEDYKGDDIFKGENYLVIDNKKIFQEDLYDFCLNDRESNKRAVALLFEEVDEADIIEYLDAYKEWV